MNRSIKISLSINIIVLTILLSALGTNAQYPFYNPFYFPAVPYCTPWSYMPFCYSPLTFNAYNSYYPHTLPLLNTLSPALLLPGFSTPVIPSLPFGRLAMQVTTTLTGTSAIAPVAPSTSVAAPASTGTALSVLIASLLINTGNPQVTAVLNLILADPTLLNNPLLLNSLINTGNPQVAYVLALLSAGVI